MELKLKFHIPKKDQCVVCVSYCQSSDVEKTGMQEEYDAHQCQKFQAQEHKKETKMSVKIIMIKLLASMICKKYLYLLTVLTVQYCTYLYLLDEKCNSFS